MEKQTQPVHYDSNPPARKPYLSYAAAWLAATQVLWSYPAAFLSMVVLCDNGWVRNPLAEVLSGLFVGLPSVAAVTCGALALSRSDRGAGFVPAIVAIVASAGWLTWVGIATVHELHYPSPTPCP